MTNAGVGTVGSATALMAVAVTLGACDDSDMADASRAPARPTAPGSAARVAATERPRGVVEDCSTRSEASFPGAYSDSRNLVVGPLVLVGAAHTPADVVREFGGNKFAVLVRAGHRVTVELSRRTRRVAGLAYGRLPQGEVRLRDANRVVTFIACRRGESSGSSASGRPVTFWSGFVLTRSPRCVPLRVWVDDSPSPRHRAVRLGVRRCAPPARPHAESTPRLAFFRTKGTSYQIATADGRGRRIRVLAGKSVSGSAIPTLFTRPVWSPNGRRLAFAGVRSRAASSFRGDIYTMRADGSRQRRITNSHDAFDPIWSPDGRTIVFTRIWQKPNGSRLGGPLWAMRPDGSNQRELTRRVRGQIDRAGSFAPDGSQLAFTRRTCGPPQQGGCYSRRRFALFLMRPDGSEQDELLDGAEGPAFSPDGKRIAFVSARDENGRLNYGDLGFFANELYVMDADGSDQRRLTRTRNLNEAHPSWLPDGARLAFQRGEQIQNAEAMSLHQINPDGTCERKILADPRLKAWFASPSWRPGGPRRGRGPLSC